MPNPNLVANTKAATEVNVNKKIRAVIRLRSGMEFYFAEPTYIYTAEELDKNKDGYLELDGADQSKLIIPTTDIEYLSYAYE